MMTPAVAGERTLAAFLLGAAFGVLYGFLRPLRPKYTWLADTLFVLAALIGWVYLAFGICEGDPRVGQWAAAMAGGWVFDLTAGKPLGRLFRGFWALWGRIFRWFRQFFKKFLNFCAKNRKKYLHLRKNRVQYKMEIHEKKETAQWDGSYRR